MSESAHHPIQVPRVDKYQDIIAQYQDQFPARFGLRDWGLFEQTSWTLILRRSGEIEAASRKDQYISHLSVREQ